MDVIERVRKEHQDIDGMLQELSMAYNRQLMKKMKLDITAHMSAEEASLYHALGSEGDAVKIAKEHQEIRRALGRFLAGDASELASKVTVLAEVVRAHIQKEEELLVMAEKMFDQEKIGELTYLFEETERRIKERAL